jgi:transposase
VAPTAPAGDKKKCRDHRLTLVTVDETCVTLHPECIRTFAPRGQTPVISAPARRTRVQAIIGITPAGELAYRIQTKSIRGSDCVRFLAHLLRRFSGNLLVVWDRLPAHRSTDVKEFLAQQDRLTVEYLPAYSPDLNPEEWINKAIKRDYKRNRILKTLEELRRMLRNALEALRHRTKKIISCFSSAHWF